MNLQQINYHDKIYCLIIYENLFTDHFCKMSNKKSGLLLIVYHDSKSEVHCALLCQQTEGCLGFDYTMDGVCSLAQTNTKTDSVDPQMSVYMRCWTKVIIPHAICTFFFYS